MLIDEALQNSYERKPRTYYLAQASCGARLVRGSWRDMYSYAVVNVPADGKLSYENEITWGSFHSTKQLAERQAKAWDNYAKKSNNSRFDNESWEVVELQNITASEARKIKKLNRKNHELYVAEQNAKELSTELVNN